jgi:hypothetical protein
VLATTLQHFFPELPRWLREVRDPRNPFRIVYEAPFLIMTGVMMFLQKLGSRRRFKYDFDAPAMLVNINRLAKTNAKQIEHPDTLEYFVRRLGAGELPSFLARFIRQLARKRSLDPFRMMGNLLVAVDATGNLTFRTRHCDHCLTQKQGDVTVYYHMALEAKLVAANGLALSLATEFIENPEPEPTKQDCETKAFARLAPQLKKAFPQMAICLLLDALYLQERVIRECRENRWAFIITFKEGSAPAVWSEFKELQQMCPENHLKRKVNGVRQEFRWVNDLEFGNERVSAIECIETTPESKVTRFAWVTSFRVDASNVVTIANQGGRLRWKIENEGFNEQKNSGYNLEHAYSENEHAAKNYYILLQIAHLIEMLIQKGNLLVRRIGRTTKRALGGVRKLGEYLKESLRNYLIPDDALDAEEARRIQIRLDSS